MLSKLGRWPLHPRKIQGNGQGGGWKSEGVSPILSPHIILTIKIHHYVGFDFLSNHIKHEMNEFLVGLRVSL